MIMIKFEGWYLDNDTFIEPFTSEFFSNQQLTENITVYAKWDFIYYYTINDSK